jgi:hypothetical protein
VGFVRLRHDCRLILGRRNPLLWTLAFFVLLLVVDVLVQVFTGDNQTPSGDRVLLDNVHGWVKPGMLGALMGSSGAGKTRVADQLVVKLWRLILGRRNPLLWTLAFFVLLLVVI